MSGDVCMTSLCVQNQEKRFFEYSKNKRRCLEVKYPLYNSDIKLSSSELEWKHCFLLGVKFSGV